jgi:hypothetical protein
MTPLMITAIVVVMMVLGRNQAGDRCDQEPAEQAWRAEAQDARRPGFARRERTIDFG